MARTPVQDTDRTASGGSIGLRAAVYTGLAVVIAHLRRGRRWARGVLAVVLGGAGSLTLVAELVGWLLDGGSPAGAFAAADASFAVFAAVRTAHILAVAGAMVLMFLPRGQPVPPPYPARLTPDAEPPRSGGLRGGPWEGHRMVSGRRPSRHQLR